MPRQIDWTHNNPPVAYKPRRGRYFDYSSSNYDSSGCRDSLALALGLADGQPACALRRGLVLPLTPHMWSPHHVPQLPDC